MAINSGDKVKGNLSARFFNRGNEVFDWYDRTKARGESGSPRSTPINNVTAYVRNDTGGDLRRGEVVEFDGSLLTQPDPRVLSFSGVTPDLTHVGWGITLQQIPSESMNEVLCLGVCIAWVNIMNEDHEYATRAAGEVVLQSGATGPVKILHKPTGGSPPEERECIVQIMDEKEESLKLIKYDWLPAAFGGSNGSYPPTNDYGNRPDDITTKRRLYFRTCNQWHCVNEPAAGPPSALFDGAPEFSTSYLE